tara:strand:- start:642 stop:746 length:105 start_codon:yes stop_codon:yes gene_type:complete
MVNSSETATDGEGISVKYNEIIIIIETIKKKDNK